MSPKFTYWIALIVLSWVSQLSAQPKKLALLIGVSTYPPTSGWKTLHSANDLVVLGTVLTEQGYAVQQVVDEKATKKGILEALSNAIQELQPGDMFHFHFSGHGQQVQDVSGDEFDNLDEALVPFDASSIYTSGYTGQNHLLDDELRSALLEIREKIGPTGQVFVTLDACHSGTATRSISICRGTDAVMASPDFKYNDSAETGHLLDEAERNTKLAPVVVFTASSERQANWEFPADDGKRYGPLSYALAKVLPENTQTTYKGLFDKVRSEMAAIAPKQTPFAEGTLNMVIGENETMKSESPHFTVAFAKDKKELQINGGLLHQLHPGTKLLFYPSDTWEPAKAIAIASGKITYSELIRADVELDAPIEPSKIISAWAFIADQQLGDSRLAIQVHLPNHKDLEMEFREQIATFPAAYFVDGKFDLLLEETATNQFRLSTHDEFVLCEAEFSTPFADAAYLIEDVISKFYKYKFLKNLQYDDPWLRVSMKIKPVHDQPDTAYDDGIVELEVGEQFYIEITNNGEKACYINLLDIQPDAIVTPLIPGLAGEFPPQDLLLMPGQSKRLRTSSGNELWDAGLPAGYDVLKLIATEDPIDLRTILSARGSTNEVNPILRAFYQSFSMQKRSSSGDNLSTGAASVTSAVIHIVADK